MNTLARIISIAGHPTIGFPFILWGFLTLRGAATDIRYWALVTAITIAAFVLLLSLWQIKTGRWAHVDASDKRERVQLNRILMGLLWIALGAALLLKAPAIICGLCAGLAVMMSVITLSGRYCHISHHVSFTALAIGLFWGHWGIAVLSALAAMAMVWSRLKLGRHSAVDVSLALIVGAATGLAINLLT